MMDTKTLEQIGLSKNEIKVYFALLELDQSTATPLVRKAGIPYSKIYPIVDKLIEKGLASFVTKNNVKHFQPTDPHRIIDLIYEKEKQLQNQKENIRKLIPQFEAKRKEARQEALVYEGLEGVKAAFSLILQSLKPHQKYFVFTLGHELERPELLYFFRDYHKKRIEKKIEADLIASKKIKAVFEKHHRYRGMNVRYSKLSLPTGVFIFADYVMTVVWDEKPTALLIKSESNAKKYQKFFKEMWEAAL